MWSQLPKVQNITPKYITLVPSKPLCRSAIRTSKRFKNIQTNDYLIPAQNSWFNRHGQSHECAQKAAGHHYGAYLISLTNPGFVEPPSIRKRTTGTNLLEQHYLNKIKQLQRRKYNEYSFLGINSASGYTRYQWRQV